jgi:UDP-glucose 4-epimerase
MKKVLITGNSGYIGSHLSKLIDGEYEIYGLDIQDPQIVPKSHYKINICDLPYFAAEWDCVVHLAALVNVGESEKFPAVYYENNLFGTLNLLRNIKTKNFIFASTGAAVQCESAYGISKRAAEDCVGEHCTKRNIDYTIFRFYNVIGSDGIKPTNPDGLFYNLMKSIDTGTFTIYGNDYTESWDGTCVRDYVHVNEICNAIKTAIEKPSNGLENLGHGVGHTVKEMAHLFEQVNDVTIDIKYGPRREGDVASSVLEKVSPYMKQLYTLDELLKVT